MKHLLSILILFGFVSVVTAEEKNLLCRGEYDQELDISLDEKKMWLNDYLFNMEMVRDDIIVASANYPPNEYLEIDRITGDLRQYKIKDDGSVNVFFSAKCELLEKLF